MPRQIFEAIVTVSVEWEDDEDPSRLEDFIDTIETPLANRYGSSNVNVKVRARDD